MAQNLLAALGARIEAQLNAKDARAKTIEDAVKAQVSANPPAPFTLLADGTKQFGYAPTTDTTITADSSGKQSDSMKIDVGATFRRKGMPSDIPMPVTRVHAGVVFTAFTDSEGSHEMAFPRNQIEMVRKAPASVEAENTSDPIAPFAALMNAAAQIFNGTVVETKTASAEAEIASTGTIAAAAAAPTSEMLSVGQTPENPILMTGSAETVDPPIAVTIAAPAASERAASSTTAVPATAATAAASAAAAATTAATATTASSATEASTAASKIAAPAAAPAATTGPNATASFVMLSDGTKQFGYAPTGGVSGYVPPAKTPPVPTEYGVGATIRRKGSFSDTPITVTRVGDGVVFANFTDSEGTREMAFYPNQMDLMSAAP
jgi:hypothetical protein